MVSHLWLRYFSPDQMVGHFRPHSHAAGVALRKKKKFGASGHDLIKLIKKYEQLHKKEKGGQLLLRSNRRLNHSL